MGYIFKVQGAEDSKPKAEIVRLNQKQRKKLKSDKKV